MTVDLATAGQVGGARRGARAVRLSASDRIAIAVMVGVPTLVVGAFIWFPTVASVLLSFTNWDGIGGVGTAHWVGLQNYREITTIYPPFWPAVEHNAIWLAFLTVVATPFGLFLAYQLDKNIRGSRIYQSIFFLPVVLSLAIIGFIWQLIYSPTEGLINNLVGTANGPHATDWLGNPKLNLWAVLVAVGWRHVGYIMVLYLAGLKAIDPSLREAAAIDGAGEWHAFRTVVFPALRPINIVIVVVTVIEALRAFDIVYIINGGTNGLELLSVLVTNNIIGEASRIGYGSAIAVFLIAISIIPIVVFVWNSFQEREA
ncbi:MAG TPA: sugar ABC transporter permease [Gaiellaceae bacterium]|jgi:ABC-type sugar transport system permease subunit|nr:sugar ABC transporter permease [Gaiellaceae bacterium]